MSPIVARLTEGSLVSALILCSYAEWRFSKAVFVEVKILKQLVRNVIDPERDLGHVDRHQKQETTAHAPALCEEAIQKDPDATNVRELSVSEAGRSRLLEVAERTMCRDCT